MGLVSKSFVLGICIESLISAWRSSGLRRNDCDKADISNFAFSWRDGNGRAIRFSISIMAINLLRVTGARNQGGHCICSLLLCNE